MKNIIREGIDFAVNLTHIVVNMNPVNRDKFLK
jgi:hypothetical protein